MASQAETAPAVTGRKTQPLPSILAPYQRPGQASLPKPTAANLRRFAEMPVARRAINIVKDQIASMDWQIRIRRGYDPARGSGRHGAHAGAAPGARGTQPVRQLPHPCGSRCLKTHWSAASAQPRCAPPAMPQVRSSCLRSTVRSSRSIPSGMAIRIPRATAFKPASTGVESITPLRDDELIYLRLNPRTHTSFGLGRVEGSVRIDRAVPERQSLCRPSGRELRGAVRAVA